MNELELDSELVNFVTAVRQQGQVWALGADDEGLVVCDSNQFDDTDVLLLWDSEEKAKAQCNEEWAEFEPVAIPLDELLDEWIEELNADSALLGLNWNDDNVCVEIEPTGLARALED
ncbi:DUF2750 domain-containing protein [Pseudoalteromonas xiamenensis]|uniref:DUF2750 domain-containing protein n=1 Tax=Pseudoalteromonas xiamenensis TaxID=882626 RepID=UPI0027E51A87|nr:DUF2750 domain-containing protein [Pseudoalteromonas xiamenensis]WMN61148.1 DUF2750 domain-containing protein [Pseudoalteromonas xiamenensis]